MHRCDAIGLRNREKQRGHDQDGGIDIHKGSHKEEQDIDHDEKPELGGDIAGNRIGKEV